MTDPTIARPGAGETAPAPAGVAWQGLTLATAAGLWLLSRPFSFLENDGRIYLLMALARNEPARYANDLFLKFGSQDRYSVFSTIYGEAVRFAGASWATMILLLIGAGLWLWGSWRLLRRLTDTTRASAALFLLAGLNLHYGGFSTLYVGESFLTARIYAEALGLLSLSFLVGGRWAFSVVLMLTAGLFHPLTAAGALATGWLVTTWRRPAMLLLAVAGIGLVAALATAGVPPFGGLLATMDPAWLAAVHGRNGFVFLSNWTVADWSNLVVQASAASLAAIRTHGLTRAFFLSVLASAGAGVIASWIGADLLHNVFVIQLQPWRLTWPLAWASAVAIAVLAPAGLEARRWILPACLLVALIVPMGWPAAALALASLVGGVLRKSATPLVANTILLAAGAYLALYFIGALAALTQKQRLAYPDLAQFALVNLRHGLTWILATPLSASILLGRPRIQWAGLVALALGLTTWDQRQAFDRYVLEGPSPIFVEGPVLWGPVSSPAWFLLGAPSYLGMEQASGLLFSRQTALAWYHRLPLTRGQVPDLVWRPDAKPSCASSRRTLTSEDLQAICRSPDPPSVVISPAPAAGVPMRSFTLSTPITTHCEVKGGIDVIRTDRFFAYSCTQLR